MSDKGRWYRVYPRQVEEHEKFADLTGVELGAWMALRSAAELRDRATIADRAEAVLVLKRRRVARPGAVLDRLIDLALFDVDGRGRITVHDRADHDQDMPAEQREHRRLHRRAEPEAGCAWCLVERWDRSAGTHGEWVPDTVDSHRGQSTNPTRGQPQPAASATDTAPAPATAPAVVPGLPGEDDSATLACRMFVNGGRWLSDSEYAEAWDELDRRYTPEWVRAEIQPAYAELHAGSQRVKPWDLKRVAELRLAERARSEERQREQAQMERDRQMTEEMRAKAVAATEEDKERASIIRRAIKLWIERKPKEPIPTEFDELRSWLEQNGGIGPIQGAPA